MLVKQQVGARFEHCERKGPKFWRIPVSTGFVTTTRVTHASPAGLYAHVANRDWECDSQIPIENRGQCKDIARQLIEDEPGRNIRVNRTLFPLNK